MIYLVTGGGMAPAPEPYCSIGQADMYHAAVRGGEGWSVLSAPEKQHALAMATVALDATVAWHGGAIPRDAVPLAVVRATAEVARILTLPADEDEPPGLPDAVWRMVAHLGRRIHRTPPDMDGAFDWDSF